MTRMKVFFEDAASTYGDRLHDLLGDERHHRQSHLYIVSATKRAGAELLTSTGMPDHVASSRMKEARLMTAPYSTEFRAAIAQGIIDSDVPGAYAFSMNHGSGIVRLTATGPVLVGRIVSRGFGNYVLANA